jgi:glycosyltransferase involved in cell wall biosynthesis
MNILFLYNDAINPQVGGVERITFSLASYFQSQGFEIFFLGLNDHYSVNDERQFFLPDTSSFISDANIQYFRSFLIEKSIKIVINQGATNPDVSKLAYYCKNEDVKLISAVHNSFLASIVNFSSAKKNEYERRRLGWLLPYTDTYIIKKLLLRLYKLKYSNHYKLLCRNSDYVVLLSDKYKDELIFFMDGQSIDNVIGIPNPISFNEVTGSEKHKELLYVGRINTSQKRIDLLLQIWQLLYRKFPEWKLNLVGGGDELEQLRKLSEEKQIQNIQFFGFQDPKPFYQTASIFCMTSSFEGLPMTLLESMQYGAVPIAFSSFSSINDIIDDEVNGRLIAPFNVDDYVDSLTVLMSSEELVSKYSEAAKNKARKFDMSNIGERWINIFKELITC